MSKYPKTAEDIADELRGTCQHLTLVLEHYEMEEAENDTAFCFELDSFVFECETCNWWYAQSEMAEDQEDWICEDCHEKS